MSKVIHCKDVGFDCEGVVRADSEKEILQLAAGHAKTVYDVTEFTNELVEKVKSVIRDD